MWFIDKYNNLSNKQKRYIFYIIIIIIIIIILLYIFWPKTKDKEDKEKDKISKKILYCEKNNPCVNGSCISIDENNYRCECYEGWEGINCDIKIDDVIVNEYSNIFDIIIPDEPYGPYGPGPSPGPSPPGPSPPGPSPPGPSPPGPSPPGPSPDIIPAGTNIINNSVQKCNNNIECDSNICDNITKYCIQKCNNTNLKSSCKYLINDTNINNLENAKIVTSNCVDTSNGYVCPLGPIKCITEKYKRLCDPTNQNCISVNGYNNNNNLECWNNIGYNDNRMPWIGYDYNGDQLYKVNTLGNISTWCIE